MPITGVTNPAALMLQRQGPQIPGGPMPSLGGGAPGGPITPGPPPMGPPPGMAGGLPPPPGAGAGGGPAPGIDPAKAQVLSQMLAKTLADQTGNDYVGKLLDKMGLWLRSIMPHQVMDQPEMLSDASDILKKITALKSKLMEKGPQVGPPMTSTIAQLAGQTAGGLGAADGGANPPTAYPLA